MASSYPGSESPRPDGVGILAIEVYFPSQAVRLSDLEHADGCVGKYTVGLGQEEMCFVGDREDSVSMALTVAHSLMEKYGVRPQEIGYLQVGSESSPDRSKSIKSHLMRLFTPRPPAAVTSATRRQTPSPNPQTRTPAAAAAAAAAPERVQVQHQHRQQQQQYDVMLAGHLGTDPEVAMATEASADAAAAAHYRSSQRADSAAAPAGPSPSLAAAPSTTNSQQRSGSSTCSNGGHLPTSSERDGWEGDGGDEDALGPGPPADGADSLHACFGGTAALLAAAAWVESRRWDGRLALVVAADVALYAPGSAARATGGCGAAALLVGPRAPLVLDATWHGAHGEHAWDFFKPSGLQYPAVDGPETLAQYLGAAGHCALRLAGRLQRAGAIAAGEALLPHVHHYISHAPFHKIVRKGLARIALADWARAQRTTVAATAATAGPESAMAAATANPLTCNNGSGDFRKGLDGLRLTSGRQAPSEDAAPGPGVQACSAAGGDVDPTRTTAQEELLARIGEAVEAVEPELGAGRGSKAQRGETAGPGEEGEAAGANAQGGCPPLCSAATWRLGDKGLEGRLLAATGSLFAEVGEDAAWLQRKVGNSYTASLWHGLASLLHRRGAGLAGRRLLLYSFGSGTVAALFSLVGAQETSPAQSTEGGRYGTGCEGQEGREGQEEGGRGRDSRFSLGAMQRALALNERLACRTIRTVEQYNAAAEKMEALNGSVAPYCPTAGVEGLVGGAYHLERIDEERRRWYVRKEK